jgi:hypothetical protein
MAIKKRLDKHRSVLSPHEDAWLEGNHDCGFVQFKRDDELQALRDAYGDHDAFVYEPPMSYPKRRIKSVRKLGLRERASAFARAV